MGEQTMETQKKVSLTKKDLNKAYWTFETYAQACCSYERLQAPGFFSGMRNIIDKLYDDDPEQKSRSLPAPHGILQLRVRSGNAL